MLRDNVKARYSVCNLSFSTFLFSLSFTFSPSLFLRHGHLVPISFPYNSFAPLSLPLLFLTLKSFPRQLFLYPQPPSRGAKLSLSTLPQIHFHETSSSHLSTFFLCNRSFLRPKNYLPFFVRTISPRTHMVTH